MQNEKRKNTEQENKRMTYKLWNFNQYKHSIKSSNKHRKAQHQEEVKRIKSQIFELKEELKETKNDPIKVFPSFQDFQETIKRQKEMAKERGWEIIE